MNKISNFLWKLFSAVMVFGYNVNNAPAESVFDDLYYPGTSYNKQLADKTTLCPQGWYVYECNNLVVGYNWLKNYNFTYKKGNYYPMQNYLIGDNEYEITEQMRAFFSGSGQIKYPSDLDPDNDPDKVVKRDRDVLLGLLCNPLKNIVRCRSCPPGGTVGESYVLSTEYEDEYANSSAAKKTLLIRDSWNFHTIADCYMNEFEDSSGSYVFVPTGTDLNTVTSGADCYYSNIHSDKYEMAGNLVSYSPTDSSSAQNTRYYTDKYY